MTQQIETNKLGLTLDSYRYPHCHHLHAPAFTKNKPVHTCHRCRGALNQHDPKTANNP